MVFHLILLLFCKQAMLKARYVEGKESSLRQFRYLGYFDGLLLIMSFSRHAPCTENLFLICISEINHECGSKNLNSFLFGSFWVFYSEPKISRQHLEDTIPSNINFFPTDRGRDQRHVNGKISRQSSRCLSSKVSSGGLTTGRPEVRS